MSDNYGELVKACKAAVDFPTNLIRCQTFSHALKAYKKRIDEEQDKLFDANPEYTLVEFLETYDGQNVFQTARSKSLQDLENHFQVNRKDPRCRHIFIQPNHSRAPLDCSREMFTYVMSFHQVMAQYMDLTFGFGKQNTRKDFHYTAFRYENNICDSGSAGGAIPRLGRSGRQLQQCYNLWGPERSDAGGSPWSLRQAAIYHSFDIESGRSVWVNISANDEIKTRITNAIETYEPMRATSLKDLPHSFVATLSTHLVTFEWCAENWRQYIGYLEENLHEILDKVNGVPVEDVERRLAVDSLALIRPLIVSAPHSVPGSPPKRGSSFPVNSAFTRQGTSQSADPRPNRVLSGLASTLNEPVRPLAPTSQPPGHATVSQGQSRNLRRTQARAQTIQEDGEEDPFETLRDFSMDELQRLNGIGADLQTASLLTKLDADILLQQMEYYQALWKDSEFPDTIKDGCRRPMENFSQRIKSMMRCLEMEQARIATLMLLLDDGRNLFDKIWQFRNMEISKLLAINAHENAQRMEDITAEMHNSTMNMEKATYSMHTIADKTEKKTASMHIITLVTLVFLPGTFVATFFGSGLYQWKENDPAAMPTWKPEFFKRFCLICVPMMAVTILIWIVAYGCAKRKTLSGTPGDAEARMDGISEKSQNAGTCVQTRPKWF